VYKLIFILLKMEHPEESKKRVLLFNNPILEKSKRFEDSKAIPAPTFTEIPKLAEISKEKRRGSFDSSDSLSERISNISNSLPKRYIESDPHNTKIADGFMLIHPWSNVEFPHPALDHLDFIDTNNTENGIYKMCLNDNKITLIDTYQTDYNMPLEKTALKKIFHAVKFIVEKKVANSIGILLVTRPEQSKNTEIMITFLKNIFGNSIIDCIFLVTPLFLSMGEALSKDSLLFNYAHAARPNEIFFANSFSEVLQNAYESINGICMETLAKKSEQISQQILHHSTLNFIITDSLSSQIKFNLPSRSSPSPLAAIPAVLGGLAAYNYAITPSFPITVLWASGVGLLYTIARGINYIASEYIKNKGIIHAIDLAKLHFKDFKGKNVRFESASIVKNTSKLLWNSTTSSFEAYNCALWNDNRDVLISMKYFIDQFSIHNLTKNIAYGEFKLICILLVFMTQLKDKLKYTEEKEQILSKEEQYKVSENEILLSYAK